MLAQAGLSLVVISATAGFLSPGVASAHGDKSGPDWLHLCFETTPFRSTTADVYVASSNLTTGTGCRSGYAAAHIPL